MLRRKYKTYLQKGYTYKGKVVRHASVAVAE